MKISLINFLQNNNLQFAPKRNSLSPLVSDTVTFSANRPKNIKFSVYQKEREVKLIRAVLNDAIKRAELLSADEISDRTGLDIYVVKLRLAGNDEIRRLYGELRLSVIMNAKKEEDCKVKRISDFFEHLEAVGQKLTEREIMLYLGCKKDELQEMFKEFPNLVSLYNNSLLNVKKPPLIEKEVQLEKINRAIKNKLVRDKYPDVAKKAGLDFDTVRARIGEDEELFNFALSQNLYPPEVYSDLEIEKQENAIMDTLLYMLRMDISENVEFVAKKTGLTSGVVQIRMKNNTALKEAYNRVLGIDEDAV